MARSKTETTTETEAPRRSSRISGKPAPLVDEKKPRAPSKSTKKRGGEEESHKKPAKKAKADTDEKVEETEEILAEPAPAVKHIDIGDFLPSLTIKNEKGEDVDVSNLTAEKGVVIFLVPKADTPGCTTQACGFRDIYPDFTGSDFDVYCLSADSPTAQSKWQVKKSLPYPLLSDPKRILITALGAGEGGKTKRSHFIFEKGGKLVDKKVPVKPADSPKLALEFIKSLEQD